MNPRKKIRPYLLCLLVLSALAPAAAATDALDTQISLLIGHPAEGEDSAVGTLVVPGTVIPMPHQPRLSEKALAKDERENARLVQVAEGLKRTLRLDHIDVAYRVPFQLEVDVIRDLPAPSSASDVRLSVKLLGYNDASASYEVQFFDRSTVIADTRVTAVRGQKAVVGGLNGEEAPYLFLILEPRSGPLRVDGDVIPPRALEKPQPVYPPDARKDRIQGAVVVQTIIRTDGSVTDIKVLRDESDGVLAPSAINAVKTWRFEPALLDGEPVDVYYNLTINYRLSKEKKSEDP